MHQVWDYHLTRTGRDLAVVDYWKLISVPAQEDSAHHPSFGGRHHHLPLPQLQIRDPATCRVQISTEHIMFCAQIDLQKLSILQTLREVSQPHRVFAKSHQLHQQEVSAKSLDNGVVGEFCPRSKRVSTYLNLKWKTLYVWSLSAALIAYFSGTAI